MYNEICLNSRQLSFCFVCAWFGLCRFLRCIIGHTVSLLIFFSLPGPGTIGRGSLLTNLFYVGCASRIGLAAWTNFLMLLEDAWSQRGAVIEVVFDYDLLFW